MKYTNVVINVVRKLCGNKFPRSGKRLRNLFLKIAPQKITCELFPNMIVKLDLNDLTMRTTYLQGDQFEFPTTAVFKSWGGEKFFDIGANYGFYSLFMLHQFNKLSAYAFEPNPLTFRHLESTKIGNRLDRLHIFNCGLGSRDEQLELHPGIVDSGHSTFLNHRELAHLSLGEIPITTFDTWMKDHNLSYPLHPTWVAKIDVEGMEYSVLLGMEKAFSRKVFKGICIEILEHTLALDGHKPDDIFQFLGEFGYHPINQEELIKRFGRTSTMNVFFEPN